MSLAIIPNGAAPKPAGRPDLNGLEGGPAVSIVAGEINHRPVAGCGHEETVVAVSAGSAEELHSAWLAGPETLLLVEDDPADMVLVEELLADSGIRTTLVWARTLAEAKQRLRRDGVPGCILLDLHLPDARGVEVVSQVLAVAPAAAIVVLTGLAEENAGLAAVAAGAQDYLIKGQAAPHAFGRAIRYAAQRKHVEQASAALRVSEVQAEENARLERGLLPTPLLRTDGIEVVARYRPGREQSLLGGDFYDVVETPDGTVHAMIGDVAGHGPAEAATGVCLRVAWRSLVLAGTPTPALITLLEQMLVAEREGDRVFATLSYLALLPDRRRVRILRAGHPGVLRRVAGRVDLVEGEVGPALGLVTGHGWRDEEMPLPPGASLMLFTDGLFEGRTGPGSERLGEEGLVTMARELADRPAAAFVDGLIERVETATAPYGGLADDVAVVHLRWRPGASAGPGASARAGA
jgi:serine phosphatase RsbU (regulator of sigma subunit)